MFTGSQQITMGLRKVYKKLYLFILRSTYVLLNQGDHFTYSCSNVNKRRVANAPSSCLINKQRFWRKYVNKMNNKISKVRIPKEIRKIHEGNGSNGIWCNTHTNDPDNFTKLLAIVKGPKDSPYDGGKFELNITIGEQYPFRPPTITFLTPVYHPNIDNTGKICLDLLRMPPTGSYNPAITLESILLSIQLLLANPNPEDPLQGDAADLFKSNRSKFNEKAATMMQEHCVRKARARTADESQCDEAKDKEIPPKLMKLC